MIGLAQNHGRADLNPDELVNAQRGVWWGFLRG
jgi:hypothetical protein